MTDKADLIIGIIWLVDSLIAYAHIRLDAEVEPLASWGIAGANVLMTGVLLVFVFMK